MQDPVARLGSLRKEAVGGLLLVTQQYSSDSRPSDTYITIIAAPLLATLGQFSAANPPGITYSNFWDEYVFAPYGLPPPVGLHCPLVAATEGFSHAVKLPGAVDLLTESQPMLFSLGGQLVVQVPLPSGSVHHTFFSPEVCGLPLGMAWPTKLSFVDLYVSIQGLNSAYPRFLPILTSLQPKLS
jgi:hypothetical protein